MLPGRQQTIPLGHWGYLRTHATQSGLAAHPYTFLSRGIMAAPRLLLLFVVCCAFHHYALATTSVSVKPLADPVWYIQGRPLRLTCIVEDEEGTETPNWLKEGFPVGLPKHEVSRHKNGSVTTLTLTIDPAGVDDLGLYSCQSGKADILKNVDMFSVFTKDSNVTEGYETVLECSPESEYQLLTIAWLRDDVPLDKIPELKDRLKYSEKNETVSISDSKLTDSGIYTCRIEMNGGSDMEQVFLENITAMGKPFIRDSETPEKLQEVTNTSALLKCPAGGQPPPQIFWLRGDEVLESSPKFAMSSLDGVPSGQLNIVNLTVEDMGTYKCTAENSRGKATVKFEIGDPGNVNSALTISPGKANSIITLLSLIFVVILARET